MPSQLGTVSGRVRPVPFVANVHKSGHGAGRLRDQGAPVGRRGTCPLHHRLQTVLELLKAEMENKKKKKGLNFFIFYFNC